MFQPAGRLLANVGNSTSSKRHLLMSAMQSVLLPRCEGTGCIRAKMRGFANMAQNKGPPQCFFHGYFFLLNLLRFHYH